MRIILRHANTDFDALTIAQGMENAGACVISVSQNGMTQPEDGMAPTVKFIVWAKYEDPLTTGEIDDAINREFER